MDQSKRVEIALSILGWDSSKYNLAKAAKSLKDDLMNEIAQRMILVSTGEGNPILRNDQWAYGILLSL